MKINTNNLYLVILNMVNGYNQDYTKVSYSRLRQVIVYRDRFGNFFDIHSKERYKLFKNIDCYTKVGTIFIDLDVIIPLTDLIRFDDVKIEKSKVLKKINELKIR